METHYGIKSLGVLRNAAVTVGTFDGVHLGHAAVLDHLKSVASKINGQDAVVTFDVPPRSVTEPWLTDIRILNTPDEKMERIAAQGIAHLIILPFTLEFSKLSPEEFIRLILVDQIGMKAVVPGYDHMFGHKGQGGKALLEEMGKQYGFIVEQSPEFRVMGEIVSSSIIRKLVAEGRIAEASSFLGYSYNITGRVVYGRQLGRTIGFPTINIEHNNGMKLIPGNGVYAVEVMLGDRRLKGMCNIGNRPTVNGTGLTIEANIFDFNEDVYGIEVKVLFKEKIRNEVKFNSINELKVHLKLDQENALDILL